MPRFGTQSLKQLKTCHPDLIIIHQMVIKYFDHAVREGQRSIERQFELFQSDRTKIDGITKMGKHNFVPSMADDSYPWPVNLSDKPKMKARFYMYAGYMFMATEILYEQKKITHKLRWGGDWDSDKDFTDQSFDDLPHMELYKPRRV